MKLDDPIATNYSKIGEAVTFGEDDRGVFADLRFRMDDSGFYSLGKRPLKRPSDDSYITAVMQFALIAPILRRLRNLHLQRTNGKMLEEDE